MGPLELRPMGREDREACVELFLETFSQPPWNDAYSREQVTAFFDRYFADSYFLGYVLLEEGRLAGLCLGAKKPWLEGMEYYIDQFCIHPRRQGKGLGSRFLRLVEEDARRLGLNGLLLMTERGYPSYGFYRRNGFSELGDTVLLVK